MIDCFCGRASIVRSPHPVRTASFPVYVRVCLTCVMSGMLDIVGDVPEICRRYVGDLFEMCGNVAEMCRRFAELMTKIIHILVGDVGDTSKVYCIFVGDVYIYRRLD